MAKHSEQTKKIYKNVVFMMASALVLIAATVAWFASGNQANVTGVGAKMGDASSFQVDYFTTNYYTMAGADKIATLAERESASWNSTSNINITTLIPGQYYSYKMVVTMNTSKAVSVDFETISCSVSSPSSLVEEILSAVKVYAVAAKGGVSIGDTTTNLFTLFGNKTALTTPVLTSGDVLTIYFDVYFPGDDSSIDYDLIRESGATVSVNKVTVS